MKRIKFEDIDIGIDWDFEESAQIDIFVNNLRQEISLYDSEYDCILIKGEILLILEREDYKLSIRAYKLGKELEVV